MATISDEELRFQDLDENSPLKQQLQETLLSGGDDIVFVTDPDVPIIDLSFAIDWAALGWAAAKAVAGAIASGIVTKAIKRGFGLEVNYQQLLNSASDEIVARVRAEIDDALLEEYLADCESVRSELITYSDAKDERILLDIRSDISKVVQRLARAGDKKHGQTAASYMMAANLHLMTIRALAAHNSDYKKTLKRLCFDYAKTGERLAGKFLARVKNDSVSRCSGNCSWSRGGGRGSEPSWDCSKSFTYDYGEGSRYFGSGGCDDGDESCVSRRCNRARSIYYNDRVNPARERHKALMKICSQWRKVNLDNIKIE